jgi:hypothetical protein
VDRADGRRRLRRPGEPCRATGHLSRPGRQSAESPHPRRSRCGKLARRDSLG